LNNPYSCAILPWGQKSEGRLTLLIKSAVAHAFLQGGASTLNPSGTVLSF